MLLLAVTLSACGDKPPVGQIVVYVDTDAVVPEPAGATRDATRLSPLVDRARFEVLVDGQAQPGTARDFPIDAEMLRQRRLSFGIVPPPRALNVGARVTLFRADRVAGDVEAGVALRTTVTLPPVGAEGIVEVSTILHTDDFGAEIGPVPATPGPGTGPSLVNTWHGGHRVPCTGTARPGEACVSGGAYFFGNPQFRGRTTGNDITAERLVSISPFYLDLTEVTVEDFRRELPALFSGGAAAPTPGDPTGDDFTMFCTWTAVAADHERLPVNCISWATARAYCKEFGKDLPTEAQMEFVTSGLGEEWAFPWGNDEPDCRAAIWGRAGTGVLADYPQECRNPTSQSGAAFPGLGESDRLDSNVLRNGGGLPVLDLGGNLSEWMLDTWARPTDAFWNTLRPMHDPLNTKPSDVDGDNLVARGGNWSLSALTTRAGFRLLHKVDQIDAGTGFRCARPGTGG
jgi:formylglycine-generating enzyme required for sulfatase activity